ncbi:MAG: FAD-binding oxidoreductase [Gemmatimonadetes bacterium]|nr:FAD-binding oxidoreductase [Gemmatimonadota bacterium]
MRRRQFFPAFAGLVVTAAGGFRSQGVRPRARIVVAGGGIVGSAIAVHLARRGADVTLLEKERPGAGATSKSFAWLNANFGKQPWHYNLLSRLGMYAYRALEREWNGELQVQWGGSVQWTGEPEGAERLRQQVRREQEWGYAARLLEEAEFRALEERFEPGPLLAAGCWEEEGSIDPLHAVDTFLKKAREAGARVVSPGEVTGLDLQGGRLRGVRSSQGDLEADVLVVACGVDTPRVVGLAGVQVPLVDSPGVLAHTTSQPRIIQRVVRGPGFHTKQKLDGRIVAGANVDPGNAVASREAGARILEQVARWLPPLRAADLDQVTLGWRPMPRDGHPIIGFLEQAPDVYVAVTHSGVTLGALLGRLATLEILDGVRVDLLEPYRLARFGAGG